MNFRERLLKKYVWEKNNALEGIFWTLKERLQNLAELYQRFLYLSPYKQKPVVKSFRSFKEYEAWKKKQKNPWYW